VGSQNQRDVFQRYFVGDRLYAYPRDEKEAACYDLGNVSVYVFNLGEYVGNISRNFTVMHEVFRQVLHKKCFQDEGKSFMHSTYSRTIEGNIRCESEALRVIERQANACAAAFLMPTELTKIEFLKRYARIKRHLVTWRDYFSIQTIL